MSFIDALQKLSTDITERKKHITNEETTKITLIMPFIQALGYDIFNPLEVKPEYVSDFAKKKGEKVDIAVFKNGKPIIFIEAKTITFDTADLTSHDAQLSRYFNATPEVKFAIITNGVTYKFFTDLNKPNIMDENPFTVLDITNLTPSNIEVLNKFRKETFDAETLIKYAEDLMYTNNFGNKLREIINNPPDDFIRYLIKDFSDSRITSNVVDRFRPIIKNSITKALPELVKEWVTQGLPQNSSLEEAAPAPEETNEKSYSGAESNVKKEVCTTEEELKCFEIIKKILVKANKDTSSIGIKDTVNYFAVFNKSIHYWFIRLNLNAQSKFILTRIPPDRVTQFAGNFKIEQAPKYHGESRIYIDGADDLIKLDKLIIECFDDLIRQQAE